VGAESQWQETDSAWWGRNPDGSRRADVAEGSRPAGRGGPASVWAEHSVWEEAGRRRWWADVPPREEAARPIRALREARRGSRRRPRAGRNPSRRALSPRPSVIARMRGGA
jgi:hypothetical protein